MPDDLAVNPAGEASPEAPAEVDAAATETDAAEKPPEPAPRRLKLSDDEEIDEAEAIAKLRRVKELERASFKRFEEASKYEKQWKQIQEADPEEFFKVRGISPEQWAYEKLQREVAMREASPEQRRALELEQRLADRERQLQEFQQQQEQARYQQEVAAFKQEVDKTLPPAMEKYGLPNEPEVFSLVAQEMATMLRAGMPADPEFAAERVSEVLDNAVAKRLERLSRTPGALAKKYPDLAKRLREQDVASARTAPARTAGKPPAAPQPGSEKPKKSFDEVFNPLAALGIARR